MIARKDNQPLLRWTQSSFNLLLLLSIVIGLIPTTGQQARAQSQACDLALILLDGMAPYSSAVEQLEAAGVRVQHVFPPNTLIGQVSTKPSPGVLASAGAVAIYCEPVKPDELAIYGQAAQNASVAWNGLLTSPTSQSDASQLTLSQIGDDLVGDALTPPDEPFSGQAMTTASSGDQPDYYQTSEFMIGSIAVGIILPESDGSIDPSTEDWTQREQEQVYSEIIAATNWWATQQPAAQLTFVYDDHSNQPVPTSYEPIAHPQSDQGLWIGEVMGSLGYDSATSYFTRVRDYINNLRDTYGTDWAFAVFVVDSSSDADNYFASGYFAYAYLGGPFMVMTYGNNGYGIHNMDAVAAHEMGHIFLALDQYSAAHVPCDIRAGYLDVENQNSLYGACDSNEPSIMRGQVTPYVNGDIDFYAKGQIGWWDSDGDSVLDPVDTSTEIILAPESTPQAGQITSYFGTVRDIPLPSTRRRSTTINRITGMAFRLDSGDWQPITPVDGEFDTIEETFTFALSPLPEGIYPLDLLVHTSLGGDRTISAVDMVVVSSPGGSAPLQRLEEFIPDPTIDITPTYTGLAAAVDNPVTKVEFRVDSGNWQTAEATDGHFDQPIEAFTFTTSTLCPGRHTIDVRTIDSQGRISDAYGSDTLEVIQMFSVHFPLVMRHQ